MGREYAPVVEPIVVQDTYVTGLHDVEGVGEGAFRFTFIVTQKSIFDHRTEHVVVARLVLHRRAVYHAAKWALKAIGARCGSQIMMAMH